MPVPITPHFPRVVVTPPPEPAREVTGNTPSLVRNVSPGDTLRVMATSLALKAHMSSPSSMSAPNGGWLHGTWCAQGNGRVAHIDQTKASTTPGVLDPIRNGLRAFRLTLQSISNTVHSAISHAGDLFGTSRVDGLASNDIPEVTLLSITSRSERLHRTQGGTEQVDADTGAVKPDSLGRPDADTTSMDLNARSFSPRSSLNEVAYEQYIKTAAARACDQQAPLAGEGSNSVREFTASPSMSDVMTAQRGTLETRCDEVTSSRSTSPREPIDMDLFTIGEDEEDDLDASPMSRRAAEGRGGRDASIGSWKSEQISRADEQDAEQSDEEGYKELLAELLHIPPFVSLASANRAASMKYDDFSMSPAHSDDSWESEPTSSADEQEPDTRTRHVTEADHKRARATLDAELDKQRATYEAWFGVQPSHDVAAERAGGESGIDVGPIDRITTSRSQRETTDATKRTAAIEKARREGRTVMFSPDVPMKSGRTHRLI